MDVAAKVRTTSKVVCFASYSAEKVKFTVDDSFDVTRCQVYLVQRHQELSSRNGAFGQRGVSLVQNEWSAETTQASVQWFIPTVDS